MLSLSDALLEIVLYPLVHFVWLNTSVWCENVLHQSRHRLFPSNNVHGWSNCNYLRVCHHIVQFSLISSYLLISDVCLFYQSTSVRIFHSKISQYLYGLMSYATCLIKLTVPQVN